LPGRAGHGDLATQEAGDLTADRQTKAGAAILPAGGAVCLLERFEDDALLVLRNADPGIGHGKFDPLTAGPQRRTFGGRDPQRDSPAVGKLEGVREEIAENLLQPLSVRAHRRRDARIDIDAEIESPLIGDLPECPFDLFGKVAETDLADFHRNRAGLDL
jgi:hypothetical protein